MYLFYCSCVYFCLDSLNLGTKLLMKNWLFIFYFQFFVLFVDCTVENGREEAPSRSHTGRRTHLPSPQPDTSQLSLWNILKKNIGKDLSKISMPVALNEPLSMLQVRISDSLHMGIRWYLYYPFQERIRKGQNIDHMLFFKLTTMISFFYSYIVPTKWNVSTNSRPIKGRICWKVEEFFLEKQWFWIPQSVEDLRIFKDFFPGIKCDMVMQQKWKQCVWNLSLSWT